MLMAYKIKQSGDYRKRRNFSMIKNSLELDNLFVKDSYFEILDINAKINKQEKYVIIPMWKQIK